LLHAEGLTASRVGNQARSEDDVDGWQGAGSFLLKSSCRGMQPRLKLSLARDMPGSSLLGATLPRKRLN
jgi:hypothetical protein